MNEVSITVSGFVGTKPTLNRSQNGVEWTTFRVASTRRVRDARSGEWSDGRTLWFTVKSFRTGARHVAESLAQGDPVVVAGRLSTEEWTDKEGKDRWQLVVDAHAVGPDVTRGLARFTRVVDRPDREGAPAAGDPWAEVADPGDHPGTDAAAEVEAEEPVPVGG
ncbi:single-stranded DNA-binding protein [Krasilnikoviella flava]|uniref:Single-stranded DNA-binding protein n=1 Tax=Krasilnikoviella flava TaxID=526729 RepID=A0A1T5LR94_9MICO|nr:single-stranded DNA-binding protein [Krasilnikoviella flava]SKC78048.1 single-strand DNA-binding protein [Krasilnikoviella flava]